MAALRFLQVLPGKVVNYYFEEEKIDLLGEGSFGKVVKYKIMGTDEEVAIKLIKAKYQRQVKTEVEILEEIRQLEPNKNNLLNFLEYFKFRYHHCLVFEKYDISLFDLITWRTYKPLQISEIRGIAQQMFVALDALKSINLVHGDIKPDNIMLVNHKLKPFRVKLIDFGLATKVSNLKNAGVEQNLFYRPPEVLLNHPSCSEAIDMWCLGCVLAFLYTREHLFVCSNEYEAMSNIVQLCGDPDNDFLDAAPGSEIFFTLMKEDHKNVWWLKSPEQYSVEAGEEIDCDPDIFFDMCSLNDLLVKQPRLRDPTVREDTKAFIGLLKQMLEVNPEKRITPSEALNHHFTTLKHLSVVVNSPYVVKARKIITLCPLEDEENMSFSDFEEEDSTSSGSCNSDADQESSANLLLDHFSDVDQQGSSESLDVKKRKDEGSSCKKQVVDVTSKNEEMKVTADEQVSSETKDVKRRNEETISCKKEVTSGPVNAKTFDIETTSFESGSRQEDIQADPRIVREVQQRELPGQLRVKLKICVKKLIKSKFPAEVARNSTWTTMTLPGEVMDSSDRAAAVYTDRLAGKNIHTTAAGSHNTGEDISCEKDKKSSLGQTIMKCFRWIGKFFSGLFKFKK